MSNNIAIKSGLKIKIKKFLMILVLVFLAALSVVLPLYSSQTTIEASSNNNLASVYPSKMTKLGLSLVYTGAEVDTTINSTQSFAITDKYFIAVQAHSTNENAGWIVATNYKNPSSTPAWKVKYNIGHGNGATWNSQKNQIVIVNGKDRFFFDANNGKYVTKVTTGLSASGIAYDKEDNYYIQTNGSSTSSGRIVNSNFGSILTFDAGHRLVNQDVAYYNGYIYRIGWGGCSYLKNNGKTDDAAYCTKYFGEGSNVLYQFNMKGDFVKAFYVEAGFGELESMAFGTDGKPYLLFNGKPDNKHYSVYKVNNLGNQSSSSSGSSSSSSPSGNSSGNSSSGSSSNSGSSSSSSSSSSTNSGSSSSSSSNNGSSSSSSGSGSSGNSSNSSSSNSDSSSSSSSNNVSSSSSSGSNNSGKTNEKPKAEENSGSTNTNNNEEENKNTNGNTTGKSSSSVRISATNSNNIGKVTSKPGSSSKKTTTSDNKSTEGKDVAVVDKTDGEDKDTKTTEAEEVTEVEDVGDYTTYSGDEEKKVTLDLSKSLTDPDTDEESNSVITRVVVVLAVVIGCLVLLYFLGVIVLHL